MSDPVRTLYDNLAESYHLMFRDWTKSIEWQAGVLGPLIEHEMRGSALRILDCTCGIGTQALGLAGRGHTLVGTDCSAAAIARARREARERKLAIQYDVADLRDLSSLAQGGFDVVIAADNSLPHLLDEADLTRAVQQIAGKLRPGGLFLASIRDYDELVERRPPMQEPAFYQDGERRRIYHQVWDWTSDRQYTLHVYLTMEGAAGWRCSHFVSVYRAVLREELTAILVRAGVVDPQWRMPADSGYYQPVVLARRPETGHPPR
jgi:glycine/sarcosine N-methyltransferase